MARLLLLLERKRSHRLLADYLGQEHQIVRAADPASVEEVPPLLAEAIDVVIVDGPSFARWSQALRQRRREVAPLFLPVLLLATRERAEAMGAEEWEILDEVVSVPVMRRVLDARIGTLLRVRDLSRLAHAELNQIFQSTASALCVVGTDGRVDRVNPALAVLVGREVLDLEGSEAARIGGAGATPDVTRAIDRVLAGRSQGEIEVVLKATDGTVRTCLLAAAPFLDLDGQRRGVILDFRDVSPLKRAETELREHQGRLEQALADLRAMQGHLIQQERLHALGQMASGVAHDFNNALAIILGYCDMLREMSDEALDAEARQLVEVIDTAARDASYVVKGLRGFYQASRAADESLLSINRVIDEAIALTRPRWQGQARQRGVTIHIQRDYGKVPRLMGNGAELREALTNLIFNAVDAMADTGGTITFRTARQGEEVIVTVADTGHGMDDETRQRCLEPFFTTKGDGGSGLGLAMVYGIVKRHKGELDIEPGAAGGTAFVLRFPLSSDHEDRDGAASTAPTVPPPRPLRVLAVDDQPEVLASLAGYLARDGHEVELAARGAEAAEKLTRRAFDLLVTDYSMPDMTGAALALRAKQAHPATLVILVTGCDDEQVPGLPPPPGVEAVLRKPLSFAVLRQVVSSLAIGVTD